MPSNEKWLESNVYESFIKIRKKMTMMMSEVKRYVKYSINECINNKKKSCLSAKERYIYMKWDVGDVWGRLPRLPSQI